MTEITAADYRAMLGEMLPRLLYKLMREKDDTAGVAALTMATSLIGGLVIVTGCTVDEASAATGIPKRLQRLLTLPLRDGDGPEKLAQARAAYLVKTALEKADPQNA